MAEKAGRYLAGRYARGFTALGLVLAAGGCAVDQGSVAIDPALMARNEPGQRVLRLCDRLYDAGSYHVAVGMCGRAYELNPNATEPLLKLAAAAHQLRDYDRAGEAYKRVLVMQPENGEALYGLGRVHLAKQDYEAAYQVLQNALVVSPDDPRVYNALGVAKDQMGQHAAAQDHYRAGLAHNPQDPALLNNLQLSMSLTPQPAAAAKSDVAAKPRQSSTQLSSRSSVPPYYATPATPRPAESAPLPLFPQASDSTPRSTPVPGSQIAALPRAVDSDADRVTAGALRDADRVGAAVPPVPMAKPAKTPAGTQMAALPQPGRATDAEQAMTSAPAKAARKGFAVQFGSFRSEERAQKGWQEVRQATGNLFEHAEPMIVRADLGAEKGVFYRLQSQSFARSASAAAICGEIKAKSLDCIVVRVEEEAVPQPKPVARMDAPAASHAVAPSAVAPSNAPPTLPPVAPVDPEEPWIVGAGSAPTLNGSAPPIAKPRGE